MQQRALSVPTSNATTTIINLIDINYRIPGLDIPTVTTESLLLMGTSESPLPMCTIEESPIHQVYLKLNEKNFLNEYFPAKQFELAMGQEAIYNSLSSAIFHANYAGQSKMRMPQTTAKSKMPIPQPEEHFTEHTHILKMTTPDKQTGVLISWFEQNAPTKTLLSLNLEKKYLPKQETTLYLYKEGIVFIPPIPETADISERSFLLGIKELYGKHMLYLNMPVVEEVAAHRNLVELIGKQIDHELKDGKHQVTDIGVSATTFDLHDIECGTPTRHTVRQQYYLFGLFSHLSYTVTNKVKETEKNKSGRIYKQVLSECEEERPNNATFQFK